MSAINQTDTLLQDLRLFLENLPQDLGRGSLNGMKAQLEHKLYQILAAKPDNGIELEAKHARMYDTTEALATLVREVSAARSSMGTTEKLLLAPGLYRAGQFLESIGCDIQNKPAFDGVLNAHQFAAKFPIGTPVKYFPISDEDHFEEAVIQSLPWPLGHGALVVKITGRAGGVCVEHIQALPRPDSSERKSRTP